MLIFSFPLYSHGMPAILKRLVDRIILPLSITKKYNYVHPNINKLKYFMICGCGFSSLNNFKPIIEQFKLMFPSNNSKIVIPQSPLFNNPELSEFTIPRLALLRTAGEEFARKGLISTGLLNKIESPMLYVDLYDPMANAITLHKEEF